MAWTSTKCRTPVSFSRLHRSIQVQLSEGSNVPSQVGGYIRVAGIGALFLCGGQADGGRAEGERINKRDG